MRATWPHNVLAICADESSANDRKMRVRSVWSSARHASDWPSTARSDEIDCVATIGMSRDWRVSANIFSSPAGSSSPTVTKLWYSSQRNIAGRHTRAGRRAISAGRRSSVWSHACLSITPTARDSAGFVPAGMFRHRTLPLSITSSSGGSWRATAAVSAAGAPVGTCASAGGFGGQNVAATSGRSKTERKTLRPSMMLDRSFGSRVSQSCPYQRRTASSRSRRAGSATVEESTSNAIPSVASCSRSAVPSTVRTPLPPVGVQDHAAKSVPCAARSDMPIRTVAGGSTSASTSAIFRSIRSGSSVQR